MDIREKFKREFGDGFYLEDRDKFPDYYIEVGASRHAALIDGKTFDKDLEWSKFRPAPLNIELAGYLLHKNFEEENYGYYLDYVQKCIDLIQPNEYAFDRGYYEEDDAYYDVLMFRNTDYIISIAPRVCTDPERDFEADWPTVKWEDFALKAPKSVFSI